MQYTFSIIGFAYKFKGHFSLVSKGIILFFFLIFFSLKQEIEEDSNLINVD